MASNCKTEAELMNKHIIAHHKEFNNPSPAVVAKAKHPGFSAVQEKIDENNTFSPGFNGPATLNTLMAKASYIYREKYGTSLAYKTVTGSADSLAYTSNTFNIPDSEMWTPEFFWMPNQYTRVGVQFNMFTKYLGTATNYDGAGRNANDNNTTYFYLWAAF